MQKRGKLIAFIGLDGAGKTSIINKIVMNLNSNITQIKHPPKSLVEYLVNSKNKDNMNSLSIEDEIKFVNELKEAEQNDIILPQILNGNDVICDRYIFCSYSHYMKLGISERKLFELTKNILIPDITIYIQVEPQISINRQLERNNDDDIYKEAKLNINRTILSKTCYDRLSEIFNIKIVKNDDKTFQDACDECYQYISSFEPTKNLISVGEYINAKYKRDIDDNLSISACNRSYDYYLNKISKEFT